ncbi:hypothetical protein EDB85DRAFT_1933176 [Lactarius pseudohatsudake]|nr:hypothetical protein EDB85DRAFT_1933176 [Lactarius pseudohatsudake]
MLILVSMSVLQCTEGVRLLWLDGKTTLDSSSISSCLLGILVRAPCTTSAHTCSWAESMLSHTRISYTCFLALEIDTVRAQGTSLGCG